LKSDKLEAGLKVADARLEKTDALLDKVIATSNRLGDTSATVGRRYEKFGEGIEAQRQRLVANALAFEKGDISAKKFGSVIESVDKQVGSLNSRLKDALARAKELDDTGLSHFQNQIKGAVDKSHSLIDLNAARPLQGLGPVLQGLGARQFGLDETILNILIVAARELGVIKTATLETAAAAATIKTATEGTATAAAAIRAATVETAAATAAIETATLETAANTAAIKTTQIETAAASEAAAAAEIKFNKAAANAAAITGFIRGSTVETAVATEATAASSALAATAETQLGVAAASAASSQALVAAESEATAASMTEASGVTTVFGASLAAVGTALVAGVVSILAAKKLSEDILATAEKRLKLEESITGALNKQNLAAQEFQDRLKNEQGGRDFNRFLKNSGNFELGFARDNLQRKYDNDLKQSRAEIAQLGNLATAFGPGKVGNEYAAQAQAEAVQALERQKELKDQISQIDADLDERKQRSSTDFIAGIQKRQLDAQKEADKQGAELRKASQAALQGQLANELSTIKGNYSIQEALLKQHVAAQQVSELTAIKETTRLKNAELQSQISADRKYYNELAKNAATPADAAKFVAEGNKAIADATAQQRANAIQGQTDLINKTRELKKEIQGIFVSTADNKFVTIWDETAKSIEHVREVFKGLNTDMGRQQEILIGINGLVKDYAATLSDKLSATTLRLDAARYASGRSEAGFRSEGESAYANFRRTQFAENLFDSQRHTAFNVEDYNAQKSAFVTDFVNSFANKRIQDKLQTSLNSINAYGDNFDPNVSGAAFNFQKLQQASPKFREQLDRSIVALTGQYDPTQLTNQQNQLAASARKELADIEERKREEGVDATKKLTLATENLTNRIDDIRLRITDETSGGVGITRQPRRADTDARFAR
jgi:hypothetical protein